MKSTRIIAMAGIACGIVLFAVNCSSKKNDYTTWSVNGGSHENIKYSSLTEIDTNNVSQLKVAWTYHSEGKDSTKFGPMESNPIIVDGMLFAVSPRMKLFAVDAATGKEKWKFDPADSTDNKSWVTHSINMCRGVAYWSEGEDKRIIYAVGSTVFAVDVKTGKLVSSFGKDGGVDLKEGLDRDPSKVSMAPTSPVKVFKDLFIVSGMVDETTPGHIRGFDVKTGKQKWIFHTIPFPGETGINTWEDKDAYKRMGSTNAWCGFSLDEKRGIVFAGIGSPTNDFYGGDRWGDGLYGNCIVALNANTGELVWHFQTVHHDVWDMDISNAPELVTIKKDGGKVDAIAQTTKTGFVFVLNRETGKPIFPVEERKVDTTGAVWGEKLSTTQPFPVLPKPFVRQVMTINDLNNIVDKDSYEDIKKRFDATRSQGIFTPPTEKGTLILPGYDGGGEWGGAAVDPASNVLYVNANEMPWILNLVRNKEEGGNKLTNLEAGKMIYTKNCMGCHGTERQGGGDYPSLQHVADKYSFDQFSQLLSTGRRMMPGFNKLTTEERKALASYILEQKKEQDLAYAGPALDNKQSNRPSYGFTGYNKFLTQEGYPAITPPWGTISAINLNTGEYEWKIPFGEFEELKKKGVPTTGRENYGGPVVTAGGILFIGASADGKFRAINKRTGKILWEYDLPAPGVATPAVYQIDGKQYVVIACGGSKWGGKSSDAYVAFSL